MSLGTRSILGAIAAGVMAGAAWIALSGPAPRRSEPGTATDSQLSPPASESIDEPVTELADVPVEREAVLPTIPSVAVPSAAIQAESEEDSRVVLFGQVTDPEGHPVSSSRNLYVAVTDDRGKRALSKIEEGRYSLAGLESGEWDLAFRSPGFSDFDRHLALDRSEPLRREDFVVERAWNIAIQVLTSEGKAPSLFKLRLGAIATKDPPGERLPPTELTQVADYGVGRFMERFGMPDSGSADLPEDAIGRLTVNASPPIHVSLVTRQFVIETRKVDSTIESLTFTVAPERLSAMLSDLVVSILDAKTDQPIEGATAMLRTAQTMEMGKPSGPDGLIRYDRRAPGRYSVVIHAAGYARETRLIDLEPGRQGDPERILLTPPIAIGGRIVDPDGRPVEAQPALHPYFENDPVKTLAHTLKINLRADAEGKFAASYCPAGRYLLLFGAEARNPPASNEPEWTLAPFLVDTTSGPAENLEIVLARGAELTLKPTSKQVVGMTYCLSTVDGLPYRRSRFYDAVPLTLRVAPGTYELALSRGSTEIRSVRIRVDAGGSTVDIAP